MEPRDPSDWSFNLEWFVWIKGSKGACQISSFGWNGSYGSMGSKKHDWHLELVMGAIPSAQWVQKGWWKGVFYLKSQCQSQRRVQQHILGLQYHPNGCNFWLYWFLWINTTTGTCRTSNVGDGGHCKSSMGPKRWLVVVLFGDKAHVKGWFSGHFWHT